ncbi:hypothetical protein [Methanohalophilus profundi]|uniref:hypothetical protein n=1 Tax=Methanohalophilus profundi TaxID=2138083 RepID=UPI00101C1B38|nr:hypothetical protein [Methanohalophilus profundi]
MKDVYICFTPYHIILSCAIAFAKNDKIENDLIIQPSFPNVDNFIDGIKEWNDNLFNEIIEIPGRYESKPRNIKIISTIENIYKYKRANQLLKRKYNHTMINNLYIFNDCSLSGQLLAYLNDQNGGCNIYVEDGMAAYINQIPSRSIRQLLARHIYKLTFGKWYEQNEKQGLCKYIDKFMVLNPQHIRIDLSKKNINAIELEDIFNLNTTGLPNKITKQFNLNISKRENVTILILSPSYFLIENGILNKCKNIINQIVEKKF